MKRTIVVFALFLYGCGDTLETSVIDQCMRRELFNACMAALPSGPVQTHYNDWSEVVSECGLQAQYMSVRKVSQVKLECRP